MKKDNSPLFKMVETNYGTYLGYSNDLAFQQLSKNQFEDAEVESYIRKTIKPEDICIDIGANIGRISVCLSERCKKLYSIEPQLNIYLALCGNLFLNSCFNVTPLNIAAFSSNGNFSIAPQEKLDGWVGDYYGGDDKVTSWGSISLELTPNGTIKGRKLDEIINDPIDFIKVDAEGGDLDALMGCQNIINKNKPKIIFEFHSQLSKTCYNRSWEDYLAFFKKNNYKIKQISESDFLAVAD
tara:strand:- start:1904 stop:2623 length:720 start_codon:yes stop_codon:yes gene_type:complete